MLQIPDHPLFHKNKNYTGLSDLYLPEAAFQPAISAADQQALLQHLNNQIQKEQFYLVTDVKTGTIIHCHGINRWLGHADAHFTQKYYLRCINPSHAVMQGFYASAFFDVLIKKQVTTHFLRPICISTIALKNKSGNYIYCKRQSYPFQLTADNRMTEYISEFTIIKEFTGEDYHSRIVDEGEQVSYYNQLLKKTVQKQFEETPAFSVQELRILKRYAGAENITSEMIAKAFKIEKVTVDKFNKRILKKSENIFGQRFSNAKRAAAYFRRTQLI